MVTIGSISLGAGIPKICIPLVGRTMQELIHECQYINTLSYDIAELRVDYFNNVAQTSEVLTMLQKIRQLLSPTPILFTFRTKEEGGETTFSEEAYFTLLQAAITSGLIDAVDIEYFRDHAGIMTTQKIAKAHNVTVIMSNHDFIKTPPKDEIIHRLLGMKQLGTDVAKIACMPQSPQDVLTLLSATTAVHTLYPDFPCITMSMGKLGAISRISGEIFGSVITFGAARQASAPGQLSVADLKEILRILH